MHYDKSQPFAWCNGELREREAGAPSVASISFHLGLGVFDGMMAYWNHNHYYIHRVDEHLDRFRHGAARMGMSIPLSVDQMREGIDTLLAYEPRGTQYVRPVAYRRGPELWVTGAEGRPVDVSIFTVRADAHRDIDAPMRCQISGIERISSRSIPGQIKVCGSYVNSFHARRTAEAAGLDDGIMLDREGRLAEASAANVFVIMGDRLVTPPLNPDVRSRLTPAVAYVYDINNGLAGNPGLWPGSRTCAVVSSAKSLVERPGARTAADGQRTWRPADQGERECTRSV
jgi:branched-chain amino acid aminotransferase